MELLPCTVFSHCLYFFFFGKHLFRGVCLIGIYFALDYWSNSREKFCICLFLGLKSSSGLWSAFVLPFLWMKMLHFLVMLESMVNQVNFTLWPPYSTPSVMQALCYLLDGWRRVLYLLKPGGSPSSLLFCWPQVPQLSAPHPLHPKPVHPSASCVCISIPGVSSTSKPMLDPSGLD